MIRTAVQADIDRIVEVLPAIKAQLLASGNDQWNERYPLRPDFQRDFEAQTLCVDERDGRLRGFVVIDRVQHQAYANQPWTTHEPVSVVHRLAVVPPFRGQGVARGLLLFAESQALECGHRGLRADTAAVNTSMTHLLSSLGWTRVGQVRFSDAQVNFVTWELDLSGKPGATKVASGMP